MELFLKTLANKGWLERFHMRLNFHMKMIEATSADAMVTIYNPEWLKQNKDY